jgi:hypothetical protein
VPYLELMMAAGYVTEDDVDDWQQANSPELRQGGQRA